MPYLPTPSPIQAYIITNETQDLVRSFRNTLSSNDSRVVRELVHVLGEERFVANASFMENRGYEDEAKRLDGFTTHEARLRFFNQVQNQILTFIDNEVKAQGVSMAAWLKSVSSSCEALKDIDGLALEVLIGYEEINDTNRDLIAAAVSVELLRIFCAKFMVFIQDAIEAAAQAKKITLRTEKGLAILFLASQPIEVARITHCIVNHIDYGGFMINAELLTDTVRRKDGWIVGFSSQDLCADFFKEHQPKVKEWLEYTSQITGRPLISILDDIDALKPFTPARNEQLRSVILYNDTTCRNYNEIAQAVVVYLNEQISAEFIEFIKNKEPMVKTTTVFVGSGDHSPTLADSIKKHYEDTIDVERKCQIAYDQGYAQAKADMMALSSNV